MTVPVGKASFASVAVSQNKIAVMPKTTRQGTELSQLCSDLSPSGGQHPGACRATERLG